MGFGLVSLFAKAFRVLVWPPKWGPIFFFRIWCVAAAAYTQSLILAFASRLSQAYDLAWRKKNVESIKKMKLREQGKNSRFGRNRNERRTHTHQHIRQRQPVRNEEVSPGFANEANDWRVSEKEKKRKKRQRI